MHAHCLSPIYNVLLLDMIDCNVFKYCDTVRGSQPPASVNNFFTGRPNFCFQIQTKRGSSPDLGGYDGVQEVPL